ncbi:MAG: hypothetical protein D6705_15500 [Deltaproteobacteria bacterium]|nr:MAG: hypothetical protein D6705_15500 [Deltaproteobacteria bacterium]
MPRPSLSPRRTSVVLAVFAALGLSAATVLSGCGPKYEAVEVPAEGVRLAYDLSAGRTFEGHVRRSETVSGSFGNLNRVLEYDVRLTIAGKDPNRGDTLVRATFHNVKIQWTLPPSSGLNISVDEFIQNAVRQVQGMEIRFNVGEDGSVHYLPPIPAEVDDQLRLVIQSVLDSLDEAFLQVPKDTLSPGETWEEKEKKGRKGKLGRYRQGVRKTTFKGLYRDPKTQATLALLSIEDRGEEVITTKAGSRRNEWNGKTDAYFSITDAFLAERHGELRKFDPKEGTTFVKVDVTWRKVADGNAAGAVEVERQRITDPCDPDYVGFEECPANAPADAATTDGSAADPGEASSPEADGDDGTGDDGAASASPAGDDDANAEKTDAAGKGAPPE